MFLMLDFILIGILLGILTRGSLKSLSEMQVNAGWVLLAALSAQWIIPMAAASIGGASDRLLLWVAWVLPNLVALAVAAWNWRTPGFPLVALGILLNMAVVLLNTGMPVLVSNAVASGATKEAVAQSLAASWLHVPATSDTLALLLGDVIPFPGPWWHRGMLSLGDVILALGAGVVVFMGMHVGGEHGPGSTEPV